jgi:energy-coupling factor transporter ATP-binding protein EcfA2
MEMRMAIKWNVGSRWLRWDPHLHAPGTLRNNQFGDDWSSYVRQIEAQRPHPVALGITDYYLLKSYKEVRQLRLDGALSSIPLIFPNVELRLTIETRERQGINIHLLVSPDDPEHVARIEEKLGLLTFRYREDHYPCSEDGLKRLGRSHRNDSALPERAALTEGANQFKVDLNELRKLFDRDGWMQSNVLVAVAAGKDGLAGIAKDAAFHAQREELGRFAHIVFSGIPGDRTYWLGDHPDFESNQQTAKPCLHGSDAHKLEDVLAPPHDRRCWIRAEPTFDGLRQTLVEPRRRVHIGADAPPGPSSSDVIRYIRFKNAPWCENRELELNDGLVTIIGSKGSGKTALAELAAFAADAEDTDPGPASFVAKAGKLLSGLEIEIEWGDGTKRSITSPRDPFDERTEPRVRYLSQQFVERLCSGVALGRTLIDEIERVVFEAIPDEERLLCSTFDELRQVVLQDPIAENDQQRKNLAAATRALAEERALKQSVPVLKAKALELERDRKAIDSETTKLPIKASDEVVRAQIAASTSVKELQDAIAAEDRRTQQLHDLGAELQRQVRSAEMSLAAMRARFGDVLDEPVWDLLRLRPDTKAQQTLAQLEQASRQRVAHLRDDGLPASGADATAAKGIGLEKLVAENVRLTKQLGLDQTNAKRRVELEKRRAVVARNEDAAKKALTHAEKASERMKATQLLRLDAYRRIFEAFDAERTALERIYTPLHSRIIADSRLSKLSFAVDRFVDLRAWASRGESLLDLRRPPFNRRGAIEEEASKILLSAWKNGTPIDAQTAMLKFIESHGESALDNLANGVTPLELGEWLFSTEHVSVSYNIQYEGVDLVRLSPGTKGIVLLTLYLGLDEWDRRPLIIDQPEENLDPRSIFTDLVPFFRDAARHRQIIMVTHNANLVVNTDSDQVIVAESVRTSPAELPRVTYSAGPLEDAEVRTSVCRLLEGGDEAFKKRGQRYGL